MTRISSCGSLSGDNSTLGHHRLIIAIAATYVSASSIRDEITTLKQRLLRVIRVVIFVLPHVVVIDLPFLAKQHGLGSISLCSKIVYDNSRGKTRVLQHALNTYHFSTTHKTSRNGSVELYTSVNPSSILQFSISLIII